MRKMRVAIREQLAALVLFAVLVALAIVSIPTWIYVNQFVIGVTLQELSLTASLKSSRISSELNLIQTSIETITSRVLVQSALNAFYDGNRTDANFVVARRDVESALSVGGLSNLLQGRIYSRNTTGDRRGVLNITGSHIPTIRLPYDGPDGQPLYLGDTEFGYPVELYPNVTYTDLGRPNMYNNKTEAFMVNAFPDVTLSTNGGLVLGPLVINESFALISITVPIRDVSNLMYILGYMTVVAQANNILAAETSREGLGNTGIVLLVGPDSASNRFNSSTPASNSTYKPDKAAFGNLPVHFLLPPAPLEGQANRHSDRQYGNGTEDRPFAAKDFPAVMSSFSDQYDTINNASAMLWTTNEQGAKVAVGFARTNTQLVNWTVVVEMAQAEASTPISTLRNILLGCVFGTAGLILLLIFPCAHFSVMPIRRLKCKHSGAVSVQCNARRVWRASFC